MPSGEWVLTSQLPDPPADLPEPNEEPADKKSIILRADLSIVNQMKQNVISQGLQKAFHLQVPALSLSRS